MPPRRGCAASSTTGMAVCPRGTACAAGRRPPFARRRRAVFALGSVVLLDDLSRQASMGSYVKPVLLSPGSYLAAAFPAGCGPGPDPAAPAVNSPGMFDKRRKPTAKVVRMLGAQIELVRRPLQRELNRLVRRTAGQIVLQLYLEPLHCLPPRADGRGKISTAGEPRSYPSRRRSIAGFSWHGICIALEATPGGRIRTQARTAACALRSIAGQDSVSLVCPAPAQHRAHA